ncbi:MAG: thymidine phosphorylase [Deltaproteobacteria bacterium]|nr:thymidine phosphorylase [Deltaproteobacteria bacterium]
MRMVDIIRKKRDRLALRPEEIRFFIRGYTEGEIADYHAAAFLMAVYLNGMTEEEMLVLVDEMLHSGEVLDWSQLDGPKVDKHSTGGVGDKTSLVLAPIVAAAGAYVPMISGRGLGHTGGTLDKLEAIPGFDVGLSAEAFGKVLAECGMVISGQTAEVAPADRKLYALRDVTGTVESIPLIAGSILSKKLAEGIDGLVLDVKVGAGAFMKKQADALALARTLARIGKRAGKNVVALITNMDQPLGTHVGNTLEVIESAEVLKGQVTGDLAELSFELAAQMIALGGKAESVSAARELVDDLVSKGVALRKFQEVIAAQGGDPQALEDYTCMPTANKSEQIESPARGVVQRIDAEEVGVAAMLLGAGRGKVDDVIDPGAGVVLHRKVGDSVEAGTPLATLYYNEQAKLAEARSRLSGAYSIGEEAPPPAKLIHKVITE